MPLRRPLLLASLVLVLAGCRTGSPTDEPEPDDASRTGDTRRTTDGGSDARADAADATDAPTPLDTAPSDAPDGTGTPDTTPETRGDRGSLAGTFWNTYYYLADESEYSGSDETALYDDQCNPIAQVPSKFANDACIEGTALLEDGTVVNYDEPCSCGPCSFCWAEMDPKTHPWGMGSKGNALKPLRSWAVDTDVLSFGTVVYVPKWDGVAIPKVGELGGFTHDGCFRADDVGGGIDGTHFDLFAGTPAMHQALEKIHPTRTDFRVYTGSERCTHLE